MTSRPSVPTAVLVVLLVLSAASPARAQAGDAKDPPGTIQAPLPDDLVVPPAPVLSAEEQLRTFTLVEGLAIELVAADPLIDDPVAAVFDAHERLWVVEMLGFMPDVDGTGEDEPVGRIAVLQDTDGDLRMDRRTTFLDGLVLPRGVLPLADGGVLVLAPPDLLLCRDTDGDLRADEQTVVDTDLDGLDNPEHAPNGLLPTLDNVVALANHDRRYRRDAGGWTSEEVVQGGQWGLSQDDRGRLFFNTNPSGLLGHLVSPHYGRRNPGVRGLTGLNREVADDQRVWPVRITPGVNRGYREETLDGFKLAHFTAACGPLVHRGDGLPAGYRGDAFVCEPAANLVKRYALRDDESGRPVATPFWDERELLASTDERFRPVNLFDGPDGALYVVDMYRGVLQHRMYMTTFLRRQVLERGLDAPVGLGRIWRLVAADAEPARPVALGSLDPQGLVAALSHPNGWRRDRAQQELVARGAPVVDAVREHAARATSPWGRLHALWTLEGQGALSRDDVRRGLTDPDPRVAEQAARLAEPWLATGSEAATALLLDLGRRGDSSLRRQVLLSLGEGPGSGALDALAALLIDDAALAEERDAVLSGLAEREGEFLTRLLATGDFDEQRPGRSELLRSLAGAIVRSKASVPQEELLARCVGAPAWQRRALLEGLVAARGRDALGEPARILLPREPSALAELCRAPDADERALVDAVRGALWWPGHAEPVREVVVAPLDATARQAFQRGEELYAVACASCHQPSGRGAPGKAPPLRHSPFVLGSLDRLVPILLQGLQGPIVIDGQLWDLPMPALPADDADLAALLTYVRREWGHGADPVRPSQVSAIRARHAEREQPWTVEELDAATGAGVEGGPGPR